MRKAALYWMLSQKKPWGMCNVRLGELENPVPATWNSSHCSIGFRRHAGGMTSTAADGHAVWLKMPPYQPDRPPPSNFGELGDCGDAPNTAAHGIRRENGPRVKLYSRRFAITPSQGGAF